MGKRRRKTTVSLSLANGEPIHPNKRRCFDHKRFEHDEKDILQQNFEHPVLSLYFSQIFTLKDYLSKALATGPRLLRFNAVDPAEDPDLCGLLNSAIVGLTTDKAIPLVSTAQDIVDATQCTSGTEVSQSELVDLVLQILFRRSFNSPKGSKAAVFPGRPNHIFALGYVVHSQSRNGITGCHVGPLGIQLLNRYPNSHVITVKSNLWNKLLQLIGDEIMFKLLIDTCIFIPVGEERAKKTYYQLCGKFGA